MIQQIPWPRGASKRILLLSGFRIFPTQTGAHLRTGGIARALARLGYEVLIYSLGGRRNDYQLVSRARRECDVVEIERNLTEETNLGLAFGLMQAAARRLNYPRVWQYELLRHGLVPKRLRHALAETDLVICDSSWCPRIPGPWSRIPWFLLSHNLEHRLLEHTDPRHRRFAPWMRRIESAAANDFCDIFPCAEEDLQFFRSHDPAGRLRLPLIRCGVDPAVYAAPPQTRARIRAQLGLSDEDRLLVFSGSRFEPNLRALTALRDFCRKEAAFLAGERVYILVLGSVCEAPTREGAMIATGRVDDSIPYLTAADAGLNPVMSGSGANVKLFEYLAARLPILSTTFGVRGTKMKPKVDFVPLNPQALKLGIQSFLKDRSREEWQTYADAVWNRHRADCDIQLLVAHAVAQLPEFNLREVMMSVPDRTSHLPGCRADGNDSDCDGATTRTPDRLCTGETRLEQ
jgi:glycosyltransferase involved in cell wall biosynthesis